MIRINKRSFELLQRDTSETDFSRKIGVSRSHYWRVKQGASVGQEFIGKFKEAFPSLKIEDYFVIGDGGRSDAKAQGA